MNNEIKGMIKKYIPIMLLGFAAMLPSNIYGTHLVGGDMTFECLGNDYYEITLVVRRDCINGAEDAPFDDPAAVGIFDGTGRKLDWLGRLGILYLPFSGAEIVKNNVPECAIDGDEVCVEETIYKGSIYLPFREQGYVLTYQRCCRNGTINNLINPLDVGVTRFVCLIPETLTSCNSSPTFNSFPDVIVCANESLSFDASATDPDGDMLVYKLYTSHIGAARDYPQPQPPWNPPYEELVEYASGFSEDNMLGSGTALSIDENTGLITAEPSAVGQYLVGILVEEWRDGKKLSETRRDFEYNVRVCLSFPVAAFDVEDDTCDGLTVSVTNNSTDAASYLWNFNYPSEDEQFTSTEESPAPFTYAEPGFYSIRLEVMDADGRCTVDEIKEVVTRSMSALIAGNPTSCDGTFTLSGSSDAINPSFEWSLSPDFVEIIGTEPILELELSEDATIYMRAASSIPGCFSDIASQDLSLASFDVSFSDDLPSEICLGDMLTIEGMPTDESATITYGPSDNIVETPSSTSVVIQALEGQTEVILPFVAINDVGCTVEGILFFDVGTNEPPEVTIDVDCTTGTVAFNTDEADGNLSWDFGDPLTDDDVSDLGSPSYTYSPGTYTVTISSNKPTCAFATFDTTVTVPELFSITTEDDTDVKYCNDDPVKLTVMTTGDVTVTWQDIDGNELATGNELNFNPNGEVSMVFAIAVSNDPACGNDTIKFSLDQYNFDLTPCEIPSIICAGDEFMLCITDNTGADLTYEWLPASAVVSGGDTPSPTLSLDDDTDVVVRVTNADFMCTMEVVFPVDIIVVDLNVGADPDPNIFLCDEVVIFAESDIATEYSWSNGVSGPTQSVAPEQTTTYTVTATDPNGCTSTGSVTITVEVPACDETGIFIPTAFSPNGDGSNDQLLVRSNAVKDMDLQIVDRWGDEVFRTTNQRVGWNGRFRNDGKEMTPDVYAWCLIGRCSNNENIKMTGSVTLLR